MMIEILKQVMLFQSLKPQSLTLINPRVNKQSDIIEIKLPYQSILVEIVVSFLKSKDFINNRRAIITMGILIKNIQFMGEVRTGKVNCIVVKDLSRFGRNYTELGNFIEKIFPFLGVRFIEIGRAHV